MGQQQSKDEMLYNQLNYGNVEGIKSLFREGASLEVSNKSPLWDSIAPRSKEGTSKYSQITSRGANPLAMNDDDQTPLDVARVKGNVNVVRAIDV
ncbi:hypothetical protein F3Y22_tig00002799pilonHSYRG00043 [Hibiscus syriacus]|uniref:Uncharacterized protein n=1 Tax=Hibiscus syriacus TaxID=106335 RepID=A0A6A3CRC2_HIBSY|nr:hypothetical protein F3Y22_tig00002799pilonHSYRG00043 [Hibiscus syriacus]